MTQHVNESQSKKEMMCSSINKCRTCSNWHSQTHYLRRPIRRQKCYPRVEPRFRTSSFETRTDDHPDLDLCSLSRSRSRSH